MTTTLQVRNTLDLSGIKERALADARRMQAAVDDECRRTGKPRPEYELSELIGKGSFGRVYKAISTTTQQQVAIKIIDIEQSDSESLSTSQADTLSDLLKEIKSLKLLAASGARNINLVIEALPVGQSMWMITEYCAGGSVATLMKPTHPAGLQEKWIIPILREVAEAMFWVHGQGIIHRDIKCANVLVTEAGAVQLCDFGVSGIIETKLDKRSTVIGTPHWMAPELLLADSNDRMSYGTEVDIWAFGAMTYEIASGYPPNVQFGMDFRRLCNFLRQNAPRLEGDEFSPGLRSLVEYCLQSDPMRRPTIEQVQQHTYIADTHTQFPTDSLRLLVRAYKMWEGQGGSRKSLFFAGGAQGPADPMPMTEGGDEDWNFSTTAAFDQDVFGVEDDAQAVYDVYGSNVVDFVAAGPVEDELTARRPQPRGGRSRRRPPQLPKLKAPLEKVFDPNTMSSYADNARVYYGRPAPPPPQPPPPQQQQQQQSDLPLRDDSNSSSQLRESLIDLDASFGSDGDTARFVDMETIKGPRASQLYYNEYDDSDAPNKNNRRTQDWKFPSVSEPPPPTSAGPEAFRFPFTQHTPDDNDNNNDDESIDLDLATVRPGIVHHPTEPLTSRRTYNDPPIPELPRSLSSAANNRESVSSLIDLDMSLDVARPATSHSNGGGSITDSAYPVGVGSLQGSVHGSVQGSIHGSVHGSEYSSTGPFEIQRHGHAPREPSVCIDLDDAYVTNNSNNQTWAPASNHHQAWAPASNNHQAWAPASNNNQTWASVVQSGRSMREPSIYVGSSTSTREPSIYAGDNNWDSTNYSDSGADSMREPSIYVEAGEDMPTREPSIYADGKYESYKANREPSIYADAKYEYKSSREPSIYADSTDYKPPREPSMYIDLNEANVIIPPSHETSHETSREPSIYVAETYSTREPSIYAESISAYTSTREPSIYVDANSTAPTTREPSIYVSDNDLAHLNLHDDAHQYTSRQGTLPRPSQARPTASTAARTPRGMIPVRPPRTSSSASSISRFRNTPNAAAAAAAAAAALSGTARPSSRNEMVQSLPLPPPPPALGVMEGRAPPGEVREELRRMAQSFKEHLVVAAGRLEYMAEVGNV